MSKFTVSILLNEHVVAGNDLSCALRKLATKLSSQYGESFPGPSTGFVEDLSGQKVGIWKVENE